jgi:hypothetical protein
MRMRPHTARPLLTIAQQPFCCGEAMKEIFTNPKFWDTKIKIAILTLATFIAMC